MIFEHDFKHLYERRKHYIDSLDEIKRNRCMNIYNECLKHVRRYHRLENSIDNEDNPPADLPAAIASLTDLEKQIDKLKIELEKMLDEKVPVVFKRDTSDQGTVGGNGFVNFRTNSGGFIKIQGLPTHGELETKNKNPSTGTGNRN